MISDIEIKLRDSLIEKAYAECREVIGKQKSRKMYFFYEGSLDGLEECRRMSELKDFEKRIHELGVEENREIMRSALKERCEKAVQLKEMLGIYGDRRTDEDNLWKIAGIKTQIEFVYERLAALNCLINSGERPA